MDPLVLLEPTESQQASPEGFSDLPVVVSGEAMEVTIDLPASDKNTFPARCEGTEVTLAVPLQTDNTSQSLEVSTPTDQEVSVSVLMEGTEFNKLEISTDSRITNLEPSEAVPFVVDVTITKGHRPRLELDPKLTQNAWQEPALPASLSSGEEIVFVPKKMRVPKSRVSSSAAPIKTRLGSPSPTQPPVRVATPPLKVIAVDNTIEIITNPKTKPTSSNPASISRSMKRKEARKARKEKKAKKYSQSTGDYIDDEVVADYMANTDMGELKEFLNGAGIRDVGGNNMDVWLSVSDDEGDDDDEDDDDDENEDEDDEVDEDDWDEANLEDFDAISTSDECKGQVHRILRKRQRPSGLQYLIKWEDTGTDESTWLLAEALDSAAEKLVRKFEKRQLIRELLAQASGDSEDEDEYDEDEDEDEDDDEVDDDERLRKRKAQEEADFKLARILAATNDEDDEEEDDDDLDDFFVHKASGKMSFGIKPKKGKFPSATGTANALAGEWDYMDWATPSNISAKKSGKKAKKNGKATQWDLSDGEVEAHIRSQWEKDRKTKKGKKAEREVLRTEGLLGMSGKPGKKDMKAKYIDGMNMSQIHQEIHDFLMSNYPSLALPPMGKAARKSIHEIAMRLNLESKSQGPERSRFPILFKNRRTDVFIGNSELIMRHLGRAGGRFLPRGDRTPKKIQKFGGGGGGNGNHRDGDLVGGTAPELGEDNKGRRMLERMGYKSGMALGAEGNKGIVAPIIAIVKTSRAGLG